MQFSLIICTYMRPKPLLALLQSVKEQTIYPDEILIIDGSLDNETENVIRENKFEKLKYFSVSAENRGLTKQRNFGISKVALNSEILSFLDDDTVLEPNYFFEIIITFQKDLGIVGVGGIAINENKLKLQ